MLYHLNLDDSKLTGVLPANYSRMGSLRHLQISNNNIDTSELPESWGELADKKATDTRIDFNDDLLWLELQGNDIRVTSLPEKWLRHFCRRDNVRVDLRDTLV